LSQGAKFHSEFALNAGKAHVIRIRTDVDTIVGYAVRDGYEVSRSSGTIYMGTEENPALGGGSPGIQLRFTPTQGVISVRFENTTPIDTRLAVYTKQGEQDAPADAEMPRR
jgi:hypothetical protein